MIKYRTTSSDTLITPFEVVRETEKMITITQLNWKGQPEERRCLKESSYERFHDTWEEAHAFLTSRALKRLENAQAMLKDAEDNLAVVLQMTKPDRPMEV